MTVMPDDVPQIEGPLNKIGDNTLNRIQAALLAERERWFLWVPVWLGAGASLYFALRFEPTLASLVLPAVGFLFLSALAVRMQAPIILTLLAVIGMLIAFGALAAKERTLVVGTIFYDGPATPQWLSGTVGTIELADRGTRIVLNHPVIEGVGAGGTPNKIRLRLTRHSPMPVAGESITVKADLMAPPGPAAPEAHDFRRDAYFSGIGAVGYAVSRSRPVDEDEADANPVRVGRLERLRQFVSARILNALGDTPAAAIAVAYLTGDRGLIDDDTASNMRNSGLAHLLAISGMKVGLVAVLVFSFVRLVISLWPALAVRVPTRKIAAIAGIAACVCYTGLAAAPVPALRSVLMTSMAMLAILFDRPSFSLRLAAFAAIIVILWQPEAVIGVSFQMSFGAVIALIAFYESFREDVSRLYRGSGRVRRTLLGFGKLLVTTLVATLVTAPLALFHFQQEANYSVVANALAIPLNDFWIMPAAIIAVALMPFGLDTGPLHVMGKGIEAMLAIADRVSSWPYAVTHAASLPGYALPFLLGGGLWLIIWKRRWRRLGFIPIAFGILLAGFYHHPRIFVTEDASRMGVLLSNGRLGASKIGKRDFTVDSWDRLNGAHGAVEFPATGTFDTALNCTPDLCVYTSGKLSAVLLRQPAATNSACQNYPLLIAPFPVARPCAAATIIDPMSLGQSGAVTIYEAPGGYRLETVRGTSGIRPWTFFNTDAAIPPADPEP